MCFRHVLFPCIKPRSSLFRRQKLSFFPTGTAVPTRNSVLPQRDRATRCVSGNLCQLLHNCRNKLFDKSRTNRSDGARSPSRPMGILAHVKKQQFPLSRVLFPFPLPFWHICVPIPMGIPIRIPCAREFLGFPCTCLLRCGTVLANSNLDLYDLDCRSAASYSHGLYTCNEQTRRSVESEAIE